MRELVFISSIVLGVVCISLASALYVVGGPGIDSTLLSAAGVFSLGSGLRLIWTMATQNGAD